MAGRGEPLWEQLAREAVEAPELVEEQLRVTGSLPALGEAGCIAAVGAGDSYAAALAFEAAVPHAVALDPFEATLARTLEAWSRGGCVLLALSVGGRTRAVVGAARRARGAGCRVVAVTANPDSPLAAASDEVVELVYGGLAGGVGAARHLVMLAALAALTGHGPGLTEPPGLQGCEWLTGPTVHVGAGSSYPSALYAVLKLYEVFGSPVRSERLEQFLHAPIYSTSSVTLYTPSEREAVERIGEALEAMRGSGLRVYTVPPAAGDPWGNVIGQSLAVVKCLAAKAEQLGAVEPAYRRHRGLEGFTRLIYG